MSGRSLTPHRARKRLITACTVAAALLDAGCVLGDGISCNNAEVKASIATDALISIGETLKVPSSAEELRVALQDYSLHDTFELSRTGDIVSCRGTLGMRKGKKGLSDFPLDYEVTKTNDGNILYTFDKLRFGPAAVMLMTLQGMAAQPKLDDQGSAAASSTPRTSQPAPTTPRPVPYAADPNWSQWHR